MEVKFDPQFWSNEFALDFGHFLVESGKFVSKTNIITLKESEISVIRPQIILSG